MHRNRITDNRPVAIAGAAFVAAWLVGLFVAPAAPPLDATDTQIAARFADHQVATALQSLLIHAIAGVALIAIALRFNAGRGARAAGVLAGMTSLVQAAIGILNSTYLAIHASDATVALAFDVVNLADTVKLLFVATFIWIVSRRLGPRMRLMGSATAPLQALGGLAFVTGSTGLYGLLYVALPLLLLWIGALALQARRRQPATLAPA